MLLHMAGFPSLSRLSNIPSCVCVCVCHISFIRSCVDGHLGYFQILAIANDASVSMSVQLSLRDTGSVSSDAYSGVGLRGHMVVLFLIF